MTTAQENKLIKFTKDQFANNRFHFDYASTDANEVLSNVEIENVTVDKYGCTYVEVTAEWSTEKYRVTLPLGKTGNPLKRWVRVRSYRTIR